MATTSAAVKLAIDETHKALLHLFRVKCRKHPVERIVRRNAQRKRQERFQPLKLVLPVIRDVVPAFGSAQHRRYGDQKNLFQQMFPVPLNPRIAQLSKILQGIVHFPFLPISSSKHIAIYGHLYASALV
jgi:hypothetical protein